jgi:NAD(P)H-flavin reductase
VGSSGHELAEPVSAEAGGIHFNHSINARVPLTQSRQSGNRGVPQDATFAAHPSRVLACRVDGLAELTCDIRELRLAIEAGAAFEFSPGQYARIEFARGLSGHYSMASTPAEEQLVFQVRYTAEGKTGSYVAQELKHGDRVKVCGPLGSSYLRSKHAGPVLLVAGGSGLAPIYSILCALLARASGEQVALYFGVRSERDVYHERRLAELAQEHSNFLYHIVLSEEGCASPRRRGLVHQAVAEDVVDAAGYTAYLAGPREMVEAAGQLLLGRGAARRDIHADAFHDPPSGR